MRRRLAKQICFPVLRVAPIATRNPIIAQAKTLKQDKTILSALLQGSKGKRFARHILSAPLPWNRAYSPTWEWRLPVSLTMKNNSGKLWERESRSEKRTCGKAAATDASGAVDRRTWPAIQAYLRRQCQLEIIWQQISNARGRIRTGAGKTAEKAVAIEWRD